MCNLTEPMESVPRLHLKPRDHLVYTTKVHVICLRVRPRDMFSFPMVRLRVRARDMFSFIMVCLRVRARHGYL